MSRFSPCSTESPASNYVPPTAEIPGRTPSILPASAHAALMVETGETRAGLQKLAALAGVNLQEITAHESPGSACLVFKELGNYLISCALSPYVTGPGVPTYPQQIHIGTDDALILDALVVACRPFKAKISLVTSAQGGCGATSLSLALARTLGEKVALIDLHLTAIPWSARLDLEDINAAHGWTQITQQTILPSRLLENLPRFENVFLLGNTWDTSRPPALAVTSTLLPSVIRALGQVCDHLVIDIPADFLFASTAAALPQTEQNADLSLSWQLSIWQWAQKIFLLSQTGPVAIAQTWKFLQLIKTHYLEQKIHLVTRCNSRGQMLEMQETLGVLAASNWPFDRQIAKTSKNGIFPHLMPKTLTKFALSLATSLDSNPGNVSA